MNKLIYLDNAATTKTAPEVLEAMLPYFSEYYGNPSSIYDFGQKSKEAVTRGRQQIAGDCAHGSGQSDEKNHPHCPLSAALLSSSSK